MRRTSARAFNHRPLQLKNFPTLAANLIAQALYFIPNGSQVHEPTSAHGAVLVRTLAEGNWDSLLCDVLCDVIHYITRRITHHSVSHKAKWGDDIS
jgi:hypothetical protein